MTRLKKVAINRFKAVANDSEAARPAEVEAAKMSGATRLHVVRYIPTRERRGG